MQTLSKKRVKYRSGVDLVKKDSVTTSFPTKSSLLSRLQVREAQATSSLGFFVNKLDGKCYEYIHKYLVKYRPFFGFTPNLVVPQMRRCVRLEGRKLKS